MYQVISKDELYHHGIKGQKWGVQNGPPYPLSGGQFSGEEVKYKQKNHINKKLYSKRFNDLNLEKGLELATLSYDPNRTKDTDMFYATFNKKDRHLYEALFNKPIPQIITDPDGNEIGTGMFLKYRITNEVKDNIKVASEKTGAESFKKLYTKNRDFYNYVTDPDRMLSLIPKEKFGYSDYKKSKNIILDVRNGKTPTADDVFAMYRLFNYSIPSDGSGNVSKAHDVLTQRARFFNELKDQGYGAVLDTNDAIYGKFKANAPVIIFDMNAVTFGGAERVKVSEKRVSEIATIVSKALGI